MKVARWQLKLANSTLVHVGNLLVLSIRQRKQFYIRVTQSRTVSFKEQAKFDSLTSAIIAFRENIERVHFQTRVISDTAVTMLFRGGKVEIKTELCKISFDGQQKLI